MEPGTTTRANTTSGELSSLEKGLVLLRELSSSERGMTATELAQVTGLNRTTVYRLCDMLRKGGWVQRVGDEDGTPRLDIGPLMHGLGVLVTSKYDTERQLQPIIDGLVRSLDETVHIGVLDGTHVVHVFRALPESGLSMAARLGSREPAYVTALGKALLATLPDDEVVERFADLEFSVRTPNTIRTLPELLENLDRVREIGYAVDDEESRIGVKCIAAPVFDASHTASFAISVTTVPQRLEGDRLDHVAEAVRSAAYLATASFGGTVPDPRRRLTSTS
jgi:DNA-binding IclR family transcriptional regulator